MRGLAPLLGPATTMKAFHEALALTAVLFVVQLCT